MAVDIFEKELQDGSIAKYHVDREAGTVHIETGATHPQTGRVLLRFSSNNVEPFYRPAPVEEVEVTEEPLVQEAPEATEPAEPVVEAEPVDHLPDYVPDEPEVEAPAFSYEPEHKDEE